MWRYPNLKDYFFLVNPYFPNEKILQQLQNNFTSLVTQYPSNLEYQNILASKLFNIHHDNLIVCNGVSEVIRVLTNVFHDKFGIFTPTFNEYINVIDKNKIYTSEVNNLHFRYTVVSLVFISFESKVLKSITIIKRIFCFSIILLFEISSITS